MITGVLFVFNQYVGKQADGKQTVRYGIMVQDKPDYQHPAMCQSALYINVLWVYYTVLILIILFGGGIDVIGVRIL